MMGVGLRITLWGGGLGGQENLKEQPAGVEMKRRDGWTYAEDDGAQLFLG